jgi:hypothetical protein
MYYLLYNMSDFVFLCSLEYKVFFLNKAKDLPFSLIKTKRVERLISVKPTENRYKRPHRPSWNTTAVRTHTATLATKRAPHTQPHVTRVVAEVSHRRQRHHSSTSKRLRLHQRNNQGRLIVVASWSPSRPMPNRWPFTPTTGSSDSKDKLGRGDVHDPRRRRSSR